MNSLARINRELEGTFNLDNFYAHCYYDPKIGEIIATAVSKKNQTIKIKGKEIKLKKSEVIQTYRSKKWDAEELNEEL